MLVCFCHPHLAIYWIWYNLVDPSIVMLTNLAWLNHKSPIFRGSPPGWWFQTFFIFHNIWDKPSHWLIFFKMVKTTNQPHILRYFLSSIPWKNHHVWTSEVTAISFGRRSALSPWRFWMPWMGAVWKERSVKPMVNHHFPYWMILNGYNWRKLEVFCPFPWNKYGTWSFPYLWFIIISVIFHINSISIKFPEPRRFPWYKWVRCALIPH